jgi:hypothetical protein
VKINNHTKKLLRFTIFLFLLLLVPQEINANVPYSTFSRDQHDRLIYTQSAYHPVGVIGNQSNQQFSPLNKPQDIFIDRHDEIYIVDTGNNRIVHLDANGQFIRILEVSDRPLAQPEGIFVTENGDIYIADTGNKRIVHLDANGQLKHQYLRPNSIYLPDTDPYQPSKIVVDKRGFMYIAAKSSYRGLIQLDTEGNFYGFYGNNKTQATFKDILRRLFYTEEQLSRQVRLLPLPVNGIAIDDIGLIYTTTSGLKTEQFKKLNISGENRFKDLSFGEIIHFSGGGSIRNTPDLIDLTVDKDGNITTIDRNFNVVSQYDHNGDLLFFWSGRVSAGTMQLGIIHSPTAIASNSNNELFIVDQSQNIVQRFKPTHYGSLVQKAMALTNDGKYIESEPYWSELVRMNASFTPAYKGLGLAEYSRGDYSEALQHFKYAGHVEGYSDAFWQLRLQWFQNNFALLANLLLLLILLWFINSKVNLLRSIIQRIYLNRTWTSYTLIRQLRHALFILKHPLEGFSDLRYDNKGSYLSAFVLLFAVLSSLLIKAIYTGFPFLTIPIDQISSTPIIIQFTALFITWVLCNYLISSIYRGEGRFKDVFIGSAYALTPIILLAVPVTLLSNILTLTEASIYGFFHWTMVLWTCLLMFWKIQSLQNYSVGETFMNIFMTVIAMILLWVFLFILFGLISEFFRFLNTILREVFMR